VVHNISSPSRKKGELRRAKVEAEGRDKRGKVEVNEACNSEGHPSPGWRSQLDRGTVDEVEVEGSTGAGPYCGEDERRSPKRKGATSETKRSETKGVGCSA